MAGILRHLFPSLKADGADATKVRASDWNADHSFAGGALGSILYRDTGATDGAAWLADVATGSVLVSGGVGVAPAWSASPSLTGLSVTNPITGSVTGNAATATILATTRAIYGNNFNGSAALTQVIAPDFGGTGLATFTVGDLLYASAAAVLSKLPDVATGSVLVSGGIGVAPAWSASPSLTDLTLASAGTLKFSTDVILARDTANALALRNGANGQSFNLYQTYTNSTNYERLSFLTGSGVVDFVYQAAGTGGTRILRIYNATADRLQFGVSGAMQWGLSTVGNFLALADNTYDIGAAAANRPRNLFLAGGLQHGSATLLTTTTALTNGAGAGAGTLTNAPAAGNPTKWIPISDNGTTRYIPAW